MLQREYTIASRPFATIGSTIRTNLWNSRLEKLHSQLMTDIPSLRSLKASEIDLSFQPTAVGVHLIALLVETPQQSLPNFCVGDEGNDLFMQDVRRVSLDQQGIEDRITMAISPAVDPNDNPEVTEIRKRVKSLRRRDPVVIWTSPEATTLELFDLPKVLPMGTRSSVRLHVTTLATAWAEVVLLDDLKISDSLTIAERTTIILKRTGEHRQHDSGARLQYAMDCGLALKVDVAVVLEWGDGKPTCLELIGFVGES
jgi:hypothetical protein